MWKCHGPERMWQRHIDTGRAVTTAILLVDNNMRAGGAGSLRAGALRRRKCVSTNHGSSKISAAVRRFRRKKRFLLV